MRYVRSHTVTSLNEAVRIVCRLNGEPDISNPSEQHGKPVTLAPFPWLTKRCPGWEKDDFKIGNHDHVKKEGEVQL